MIISDLHGSWKAMKKLIRVMELKHPDGILFLGDLLYHGPRNDLPEEYDPKKVAAFFASYSGKLIWIRGNCDAEVDEMVTGKTFVRQKTIHRKARKIVLTHGHHLSRFDPSAHLKAGNIVIYGHYHVFDITDIDGITYLNIGSASIPKDGIAQYGWIDSDGVYVYALEDNRLIGELKL